MHDPDQDIDILIQKWLLSYVISQLNSTPEPAAGHALVRGEHLSVALFSSLDRNNIYPVNTMGLFLPQPASANLDLHQSRET